jgi:hypothetical protein
MRLKQLLNEIKMNPKSLEREAKAIDGLLIGIEYEMGINSKQSVERLNNPRKRGIRYYGNPYDAPDRRIVNKHLAAQRETIKKYLGKGWETKIDTSVSIYKGINPDWDDEELDEEYDPVEIVSPPQNLSKTLKDLEFFKDFTKNPKKYDETIYDIQTNDTTGLHINVSIPNFDKLDYMKLLILMGEDYVLKQFDRACNQMCANIIDVKNKGGNRVYNIKNSEVTLTKNIADILGDFTKNIKTNSKRYFENKFNKEVSARQDMNRIEFRAPGNDWIDTLQSSNLIQDTIYRFAVALDAACDPKKHQQEYARKLYKILYSMIKEESNINFSALIAKYMSKTLSKEELLATINSKKTYGEESSLLFFDDPQVRQRIINNPKIYKGLSGIIFASENGHKAAVYNPNFNTPNIGGVFDAFQKRYGKNNTILWGEFNFEGELFTSNLRDKSKNVTVLAKNNTIAYYLISALGVKVPQGNFLWADPNQSLLDAAVKLAHP